MATITDTIVNLNATVTPAPSPTNLQQNGAIVSVGGTTLTAGTYQYYGTLSALLAALSSGGNFQEVTNMATTFFAQGNLIGVFVLELGSQGSAAAGISALTTWIAANPNQFYIYLTPATWDSAASALNTLASNYSSVTGKTYFCVSTTTGTMSAYLATNKAIIAVIPSPTAANTEFQAAAFFYNILVNNPTPAAPIAPLCFRFAFGVTPWASLGNQSTITTILSANVNLIRTGFEGGISTATLRNGTTIDGNQFNFWYAVDYTLIQSKRQLAAAIIGGSNSIPPLYYNQIGINRLLAVLNQLGSTEVSSGLLLSTPSTPSFSAVPFITYVQEFPANYPAGIYNGFNGTVTPQTGFESITFNLDATQFVG